METEDDPLKDLRRLADAGVRVMEGGAGDPEFDDEFGGPAKWDQDVRDQRKKSAEAAVCVGAGGFLLFYTPHGDWRIWLAAAFTVFFALALPWRLLSWRTAATNRERWRAERQLPAGRVSLWPSR